MVAPSKTSSTTFLSFESLVRYLFALWFFNICSRNFSFRNDYVGGITTGKGLCWLSHWQRRS